MKQTIIHNPIIWADVPDVDVIRVENTFYMVSTSMHSMPGCPIMKSRDLVHWEIAHYVFDSFEDNPGHNLENRKGIYGNGSWAASLRFHEGYYYLAFNCNDTHHFYIYRTENIERGGWQQWAKLDQFFHDPALFFEEDGTPYVIYGCGDIRIVELKKDLSGLQEGGVNQYLLHTPRENIGLPCEGGHAYKINGMYYLLYIEWPKQGNGNGFRREVCYRSQKLLGPYERKVVLDDDMGYMRQGIAQGCIFDTPSGDWVAMLFQDHHAVGRIPYLIPVTWEDNWPVMGVNGKAPESFTVTIQSTNDSAEQKTESLYDSAEQMTESANDPAEQMKETPKDREISQECASLVISDDFNHAENKLALQWQWNHNPDNALWSFTERPGFLRLKTGRLVQKGIVQARNTLTQRTVGPSCYAVTRIELNGLLPGDCAGLTALQGQFGLIGIRKSLEGSCDVVMCENGGDYFETVVESLAWPHSQIYLKITFDFELSKDCADFFYSEDGEQWLKLGRTLQMRYTLDHFMGYRIGLYCYATLNAGGYADFDFFDIQVKERSIATVNQNGTGKE